MNARRFTYCFAGGVSIEFSAKPSADVRSILKRNGFRWSPGSGAWWRRKVTGAADIVTAIERQLDKDAGIRRPDGKCWVCGDANGFLRNYGAATPVYCDACERKERAND